jgi:vacuolar protein 8
MAVFSDDCGLYPQREGGSCVLVKSGLKFSVVYNPNPPALGTSRMDALLVSAQDALDVLLEKIQGYRTAAEEAADFVRRVEIFRLVLRLAAVASVGSEALHRFVAATKAVAVDASVLIEGAGPRQLPSRVAISLATATARRRWLSLSSSFTRAQEDFLIVLGSKPASDGPLQRTVGELLECSASGTARGVLTQMLGIRGLELEGTTLSARQELTTAFWSGDFTVKVPRAMLAGGKLSQDDLFRLLPRITWESLEWSDGVAPSEAEPQHHFIGMHRLGAVYRSSLKQIGPVAVKILDVENLGAHQEVVFFKECWAMWQVWSHPNLTTLHGVLREEGRLGVVMSLARGGSLNDLLEDDTTEAWMRQPVCVRMRLLLGIVSAVAHLHERGEIHGDLKPSNVLLSHKLGSCDDDEDDDEPALWLSDFGLTETRYVVGLAPECSLLLNEFDLPPDVETDTMLFKAPEQLTKDESTLEVFASDVYALGLVLWAGLTGKRPFGRIEHDVRHHLAGLGEGRRPDTSSLSPGVAELLAWMWEMKPMDRPPMQVVFDEWVTLTRESSLMTSRTEAVASRTEAVASRTEAVASRTEAVASRTEAVASRTEAVASRTEAVASRTEAVASRTEAVGPSAVDESEWTVDLRLEAIPTLIADLSNPERVRRATLSLWVQSLMDKTLLNRLTNDGEGWIRCRVIDSPHIRSEDWESVFRAIRDGATRATSIGRGGSLEPLFALLEGPEEVSSWAVGVLWNVTLQPEFREPLADLGAIPRLVKLLSSTVNGARHNALIALWNLAAVDSIRQRIIDAGAVPVIAGILAEPDTSVASFSDATGVFWNLSTRDDLSVPLVEARVVPLLVRALAAHPEMENVLCTLRNLSMDDAAVPQFTEAGAIPVVVQQLRVSSDPKRLEDATACLWNCLLGGESDLAAIEAGAIPLLIKQFKSSSKKLVELSAGCVCALAAHGRDVVQRLTTARVVPPLVRLLTATEHRTQHLAVQTLCHLASMPKNLSTIVDLGGVRSLVALLKIPETQASAGGLLQLLAGDNAGYRSALVAAGAGSAIDQLVQSPDVATAEIGHALLALLSDVADTGADAAAASTAAAISSVGAGTDSIELRASCILDLVSELTKTDTTSRGVERATASLWAQSLITPRNAAAMMLYGDAFVTDRLPQSMMSPSDTARVLASIRLGQDRTGVMVEAGALVPLVSLLRCPTGNVAANAAGALWSCLGVEVDNELAVVDAGAIPLLVKLLQSEKDLEAENAAIVLWNLACNAEIREAIVAAGAIPFLVRMLGSTGGLEADNAAGALTNLVATDAACAAVVDNGGIPLLAALLSSTKGLEAENAAGVLGELSKIEEYRPLVASAGVMPALAEMLDSTVGLEAEHACSCLWELAVDPSNRVDMVACGILPKLVKLLESGFAQEAERAAGCIWNLAVEPGVAAEIGVLGGVPLLTRMLESTEGGRAERAAAAIANLLYVEENRDLAIEDGTVPLLAPLLTSDQGEMALHAATALFNLSMREEFRATIADVGVIPPLVQLVNNAATDPRTVTHAAGCLRNLSLSPPLRPLILAEHPIPGMIQLLSSEEVRQPNHAMGALWNLALDDPDVLAQLVAAGVSDLVQVFVGGEDDEASDLALDILDLVGEDAPPE